MYIINEELFEMLPDEAKTIVMEKGTSVSDPEVMEQIESLTVTEDMGDEDVGEELELGGGYEGESKIKTRIGDDGSMLDMEDEEKNKIKDFSDAGDKGMALMMKLGQKENKQHGINKIPKKKSDDEVIVKEDSETM